MHHREQKTEIPRRGPSFLQNLALLWNSTPWAMASLPGFGRWLTTGSGSLGWVVSPLSASVSSFVK